MMDRPIDWMDNGKDKDNDNDHGIDDG